MTLNQWTHRLWSARLNRDLFAFEADFAAFQKAAKGQPSWISEQQLLEVALLRSQGKIAESQALAKELKSEIQDPARVSLQMGLNHLSLGEDLLAWPLFAEAADHTRDLMTRILALGNLVICLNHLGLDHQARLKELEKQTEKYVKERQPGFESIASQNLAQRLRDDFRAGEWDLAFSRFEKSAFQKGQPNFMIAWISQLPYVQGPKKDLAWIQKIMLEDRSLVLQNPRFQTVLAIHDKTAKLGLHDRVDRLYLWLWKHLIDPVQLPFSWIAFEIDQLFNEKQAVASAEDLSMLRNIFGWIQILEGRTPQDWTPFLGLTGRKGDRKDPLLEKEWLLIQKISEQVLIEKKKFSELKLSKEFEDFAQPLQSSAFAERMDVLGTRLKASGKGVRLFCKDSLFIKAEESFHHPLLARFLCLFEHETSISFERIAQEVFGASAFDDEFYVPQIQRLLVKARKILGSNKVLAIRGPYVMKSESIPIEFVVEAPYEKPSDFPFWKRLRSRNLKPETADVKPKLRGNFPSWVLVLAQHKKASRFQIEELMGWSKSTANRKIAEGLKKGWLVRKGQAAQVTYEIKVEIQ